MKNLVILTIISYLFISCSDDLDDNIDTNQQVPENYESTETTFTSQEAIEYFTGCSECFGDGEYNIDENNALEDLIIPNDLPEEFDLSSLLPPIGDQGRQGSCTSWAITYYLKSYQEHLESGLPYTDDNLMSPAYTYNQISQGICEGTGLQNTLEILKEKGAVSLQSFPYLDWSCNIQPTETQDVVAESNKIEDYKYLTGENMVLEMKTLINEQTPIIISAFLDAEFGTLDETGITAYREHDIDFSVEGGCHAMLVVGYSDEFNAFKVVNSWGENWGDDGFIWFDYAAFDNVTDTSAGFRVIHTAMIAYDLEQ